MDEQEQNTQVGERVKKAKGCFAGSRPPKPSDASHREPALALLPRFAAWLGGDAECGMGGGGSGSFLKVLVNNLDVLAGYALLI